MRQLLVRAEALPWKSSVLVLQSSEIYIYDGSIIPPFAGFYIKSQDFNLETLSLNMRCWFYEAEFS